MKGSELKSFIVLLYCNIHTWYDFEVDITNCCKDDHVFCGTIHLYLIVFYSLHVVFDGRISARKATFFSCFFVSLPKIIAKHNIVLFFLFLLLVNACWFLKENLHFLLLFFFSENIGSIKDIATRF